MKIAFAIIYASGLIALMSWLIFVWTKYQKKKLPDYVNNLLGFLLFAVIMGGGLWLMNVTQNEIIKEYNATQYHLCLEAKRSDGEFYTDSQCQFFQDVLTGEYTEDDGYIPNERD